MGTTVYAVPKGDLVVQGAGNAGNLTAGTIKFSCNAWSTSNRNTNVTKTLTFTNSYQITFVGSLSVTCSY